MLQAPTVSVEIQMGHQACACQDAWQPTSGGGALRTSAMASSGVNILPHQGELFTSGFGVMMRRVVGGQG
jgi:hypothetical protein